MIDVITDNVWLQTMAEYKLASILDLGLLSNGMYAVMLASKKERLYGNWWWRGRNLVLVQRVASKFNKNNSLKI